VDALLEKTFHFYSGIPVAGARRVLGTGADLIGWNVADG